ncbi:MAG: hypothetical protein JXA96_05095 [Sedimentisphaerales bacterium]|nr:hypothetical protein [Sedimentisphaerales bacterium]
MTNSDSNVLVALITAGATFTGVVITLLFNYLNAKQEEKRHNRQLELQERQTKLEENKFLRTLHHQRQIDIFEARLATYPQIFEALSPLEKRAQKDITPKKAKEIESTLKYCSYVVAPHCLSPNALMKATELRDLLYSFYENDEVIVEELNEKRLEFLQALHQDLGRDAWIGDLKSLLEIETQLER